METACSFTLDHYADCVRNFKGQELILRHDVDIDIFAALNFAQFENAKSIRSKYFIMHESEYYNSHSPTCKIIIENIKQYGHEIGVHYINSDDLEYDPEKKYTAHKPAKKGIAEFEYIPEFQNLQWGFTYISDSNRVWRDGCFCQHLNKDRLYVLTHPEWWFGHHDNKEDNLRYVRTSVLSHIDKMLYNDYGFNK